MRPQTRRRRRDRPMPRTRSITSRATTQLLHVDVNDNGSQVARVKMGSARVRWGDNSVACAFAAVYQQIANETKHDRGPRLLVGRANVSTVTVCARDSSERTEPSQNANANVRSTLCCGSSNATKRQTTRNRTTKHTHTQTERRTQHKRLPPPH